MYVPRLIFWGALLCSFLFETPSLPSSQEGKTITSSFISPYYATSLFIESTWNSTWMLLNKSPTEPRKVLFYSPPHGRKTPKTSFQLSNFTSNFNGLRWISLYMFFRTYCTEPRNVFLIVPPCFSLGKETPPKPPNLLHVWILVMCFDFLFCKHSLFCTSFTVKLPVYRNSSPPPPLNLENFLKHDPNLVILWLSVSFF